MKQFRDLGINVPLINNVAWYRITGLSFALTWLTPSRPSGINAPGTDAPVDIYGHDAYPLGMNCTDPTYWIDDILPANWRKTHLEQSPDTPYMVSTYEHAE